jgi:hypothetical protein
MPDTEITVEAADPNAPLEVVIDGAAAAASPEKKKGSPSGGLSQEAAISDLQEQVKRSKEESARRLAEADRRIAEAAQRTHQAERAVVETRKDSVSFLLDSIKSDMENAKRNLQAAYQAGEFEKAVEMQANLAVLGARMVEAEKGKLELEARSKAPPQQRQQPSQADNPAEYYAAQASPRSAQWIRSHADLFATQAGQKQVERAHNHALGEGAEIDSDDYFRLIEERLNPPQRETYRAPLAAAVSRSASPGSGGSGPQSNVVKLSPGEVKIALEARADPKWSDEEALRQYAVSKAALIREGKL